ncbi:hypothetical protein DFP72DRAFT_779223, partial [Ephemerocybe angulata]
MDARPPPPEGPPPSYAFVTRVYRGNMRPVMIVVAFLAALWSLFAAVGYFRNVSYYNRRTATSLAVISIILGAIYAFICVVEAFGIFAAVTQRARLTRIFAWLSGLIFILVVGTGLAKVVIHFALKNTIINTCIDSVDGGTYYFSGFWGPVTSGTIDTVTATDWCNRSWNRGSWSEIISFLCTSFLAAMFASIAFGFYRQVLDPSSVANAWRAPATARNDTFPSHYAPPYVGGQQYPNTAPPYAGYSSNNYWVPPPGGPPPVNDASKPPGYEGWGYGAGANAAPPPDNKDPFAGGE